MSDAWWYAVWPHPRSRSRLQALPSWKSGHFRSYLFPPFTVGAGNWTDHGFLNCGTMSKFDRAGFLIFGLFFVSRDLAQTLVAKSRPSVPCHKGLIDYYYVFTTWQCQPKALCFHGSVCLCRQILLPRYLNLMNALSNPDETDKGNIHQLLSMTWLDFGVQRSRSRQA